MVRSAFTPLWRIASTIFHGSEGQNNPGDHTKAAAAPAAQALLSDAAPNVPPQQSLPLTRSRSATPSTAAGDIGARSLPLLTRHSDHASSSTHVRQKLRQRFSITEWCASLSLTGRAQAIQQMDREPHKFDWLCPTYPQRPSIVDGLLEGDRRRPVKRPW
jgi:hypothetical protein